MADAGIAAPADVHFVQIKCPLLTKERIAEAARRGASVATEDTYHSMALSRGASALGVAVALGEVLSGAATETAICRTGRFLQGRQHLGRRRALAQRDRRAGQCCGLGGRSRDRPRRHERRHRRRRRRRVLARLGGEVVAFSPRPKHPRPARSAAGATPCWTTATSIDAPRPRPGGRGAGRRDRRHDALCLRRRRAPGPRRRCAGGDHREGLIGPRASQVGTTPTATAAHSNLPPAQVWPATSHRSASAALGSSRPAAMRRKVRCRLRSSGRAYTDVPSNLILKYSGASLCPAANAALALSISPAPTRQPRG